MGWLWSWISDGGIGTAATVATLVSTVVSLAARAWNRPRADWGISGWTSIGNPPDQSSAKVIVFAELWNLGDAPAFNVRVSSADVPVSVGWGEGRPDVGMDRLRPTVPTIAAIRPGESGRIVLRVILDSWDSAVLEVRWSSPPLRRGRERLRRLPLASIARTPARESAKKAADAPDVSD